MRAMHCIGEWLPICERHAAEYEPSDVPAWNERMGMPETGCVDCAGTAHYHEWAESAGPDGSSYYNCNACGETFVPAARPCRWCGLPRDDDEHGPETCVTAGIWAPLPNNARG